MKPGARLDAQGERTQESSVRRDPSPACGPVVDFLNVPRDAKVFQMLEHRDTGGSSRPVRIIEVVVGGELTRSKKTRHV